jgi:hypothetical protein
VPESATLEATGLPFLLALRFVKPAYVTSSLPSLPLPPVNKTRPHQPLYPQLVYFHLYQPYLVSHSSRAVIDPQLARSGWSLAAICPSTPFGLLSACKQRHPTLIVIHHLWPRKTPRSNLTVSLPFFFLSSLPPWALSFVSLLSRENFSFPSTRSVLSVACLGCIGFGNTHPPCFELLLPSG